MTRRADRGILTLQVEAFNQDGKVVQDGSNLLMVEARSAQAHAEE